MRSGARISTGGGIEWIHVRHEEVAAFAASGEAGVTGRLAVCAGSCGPGNLHLINGLYDANRSRVPVLAIASHIPSHQIGTHYFQETHPDRLFVECSVFSELISSAAQAPRVINSAIQHALGGPRRCGAHHPRRPCRPRRAAHRARGQRSHGTVRG